MDVVLGLAPVQLDAHYRFVAATVELRPMPDELSAMLPGCSPISDSCKGLNEGFTRGLGRWSWMLCEKNPSVLKSDVTGF